MASNSGVFGLVLLVILLPLLGILINLALGKRLGERFIGAVAGLAAASSFAVAVLLALALAGEPEAHRVPLADWITIGILQLEWAFRVDTLSATMMLVVSGVGTLIHVYAAGYMHDDVRHNGDPTRYRRFFIFFNLFLAMMMLLVSADNYLVLFIGWEGVGLCSYLLIGFWYDKGLNGTGNAIAAKKAFLTNRIGDFGFLIAAFLMFGAFGSFAFDPVFEAAGDASQATLLAITLFMLLGVTGKSAQLPLYVWLPDAMAGPTPVSALIHAATMVTAGVYLIARSYPLYSLAPTAQMIVVVVGAATALFAATIALAQFDIKKVLAYSTISQLGFMVAAVGMGAYVAGIFHLITHAFFKGLLFLAAGSVIQGIERGEHHAGQHGAAGHENTDPQDMRNMGGLAGRMKVTFGVYLIGALALAGVFPLAGFWSKDEILAAASHAQPVVYVLLSVAAFLTAFYMTRQVWLIFFGKARSRAAEHASESPPVMTLPLIVLALLSLAGGALNLPWTHALGTWLEHSIHNQIEGDFLLQVALLSSLIALAGIALAVFLYRGAAREDPLQKLPGHLFQWIADKWYVDEIYEWLILRPYRRFSGWLAETFDTRGVDGLVNFIGSYTREYAAFLAEIQTGYVRSYALAFLIGAVVLIGFLIWRLMM
ncbi:MAG: NADH-quinone oxidoreductase subunit L [Chloroflexota bacterium]